MPVDLDLELEINPKKRAKGPAFDRKTGEWYVAQYSTESVNPLRAAKARRYWSQIYAIEDDPKYYIKMLIFEAKKRGIKNPRKWTADRLGVKRSTINRVLTPSGMPSIALQKRSMIAFNRLEGAKKAKRAKRFADLKDRFKKEQKKPIEKRRIEIPPKSAPDGVTRRHWAIFIDGPMSFDRLKKVFLDFAVSVLREGATMIVVTVTIDTSTPGISPIPPSMDRWYPTRKQGTSIRYATGKMGRGYEIADFLFNLDDIIVDIAQLQLEELATEAIHSPDLVAINVYASQ